MRLHNPDFLQNAQQTASSVNRQEALVKRGNPKTLTPGPRTPTTDRVRGLPTDRSTDYPYGPLYGPPAK